jgi:hypothetical protein
MARVYSTPLYRGALETGLLQYAFESPEGLVSIIRTISIVNTAPGVEDFCAVGMYSGINVAFVRHDISVDDISTPQYLWTWNGRWVLNPFDVAGISCHGTWYVGMWGYQLEYLE